MARKKQQTAIGTILTLNYGTAEIVGWSAPRRVEVYRPFEVHPSEPWNAEVRETVFATGPSDASTRHDKSRAYDSRCSCCYLNFTHTADHHTASVEAHKRAIAEHAGKAVA